MTMINMFAPVGTLEQKAPLILNSQNRAVRVSVGVIIDIMNEAIEINSGHEDWQTAELLVHDTVTYHGKYSRDYIAEHLDEIMKTNKNPNNLPKYINIKSFKWNLDTMLNTLSSYLHLEHSSLADIDLGSLDTTDMTQATIYHAVIDIAVARYALARLF